MKRLSAAICLFWAVWGGGCATAPFVSVERASMEGRDPERVCVEFASRVPRTFQLDNTVVFGFRGGSMGALGFASVDTEKESFTVICLTHTGMKLFEVSGEGKEMHANFALPQLAERGDLAPAVGGDIRKAYFDLVPPADSLATVGRSEIVYRRDSEMETVEYMFAGAEPVLVEKRYREDGKEVCRVRFYEYREEGGKLYPGGIYLENRKYGYTLTVRLKKVVSGR